MDQPYPFREWAREQSSAYSIFAAKAPIDELLSKMQGIFQFSSCEANVPLSGKLSDLRGVPVVRVKNSPWSVVYWDMTRSPLLHPSCRSLSTRLASQVINLYEKDSSGWLEWASYESGEETEQVERSGEKVYFNSDFRKSPKFQKLSPEEQRLSIDAAADELLIERNIFIPALDFEIPTSDIERIDLLRLPEFPLGMKPFQDWMGHPKYSIFAVKSPIEEVGKALCSLGIESWQKKAQADEAIGDIKSVEGELRTRMLQPTHNNWTVVYWCIGGWMRLSSLCQKISTQLGTRVISLSEEDTSGAVEYEIFSEGEKIESVCSCGGDDLMFESKFREEPEIDNFDDDEDDAMNQFFNEIFIEEGVFIPAWDMNASDPFIKRLDLFEVPKQFML